VHGQQINNFNYFRSCNVYLQHKAQNICKRLLIWALATSLSVFFMDYNMLHPPKKSPVDDYHGRHWPVGMAPLECWQRKSKTSHSRNGPKGTTSMTHSQAVRSVPRSIEKLWHWEKVGYIIWDDIRIVSTSTFSLYLWTWRNTLNCWSTLPVLRRSWRSRDYNGAIRNDKWITIGFIYI
jgi:hypothetical protein